MAQIVFLGQQTMPQRGNYLSCLVSLLSIILWSWLKTLATRIELFQFALLVVLIRCTNKGLYNIKNSTKTHTGNFLVLFA